MVKNKRGWVKIFESFLAISFLMGFLLIVIGQTNQLQKNDNQPILTKAENILNELRLNETLYHEIISQENLPIYSENSSFSSILKEFLFNKNQGASQCYIGICEIQDTCNFISNYKGEVYSRESLFFASSNLYLPRKVNVFCLEK